MAVNVDIGNGLRVVEIAISDLNEQDLNAQIQTPEMFNQLVANIKRRGALEELPYCGRPVDKPDHIEIISGHHRVRAAQAAGMKTVVVLLDESGLNRSAIAAKQLAHNNISGTSDPDIMRAISLLITDVDDKIEAFLPPELLLEPDPAGQDALLYPKVSFEWESVALSFLPHQFERFKELVAALDGPQALLGVADRDQFDPFIAALRGFSRVKNVVSIGTTVALLTEIALREVQAAGGAAAADTPPDQRADPSQAAAADLLNQLGEVPTTVVETEAEAAARAKAETDADSGAAADGVESSAEPSAVGGGVKAHRRVA
jgi:hypothetical protein